MKNEFVPIDVSMLANLYGFRSDSLRDSDHTGNYNQSYQFDRGGESFILRISPSSEDASALRRSMEYLAEHFSLCSPVVEPVLSNNQRLVEKIAALDGTQYCVTVTKKALGKTHDLLGPDTLPANAFAKIGKELAILHDHSVMIGIEGYNFGYWYDNENCFNVLDPDAFEDDRIVSRYREYRSSCIEQTHTESRCGIIHADLHFSNIIIDSNAKRVTFCDFDDSCKGSFLMDIAMVIFDLGVILQCNDKEVVLKNLVSAFIDSYNQESSLEPVSLSQTQDFLKLLELSLFIQYYDYYRKLENVDGWLKLFFDGRQERITADVPFLAW